MDMIMLNVSRHSIKYPINVSLADCSYMAYREVPLLGSNHGSPVDQSQCVIVDGVCSKSVVVTSGVPQGTALGALMFLICKMIYNPGQKSWDSNAIFILFYHFPVSS